MGNLGDILKKHAKRLGIEKQVEAVGVVEAATTEIAKYVSKEEFEVISFKGGVLKVTVESSSAAHHLITSLPEDFKKKHAIKRVFTSQRS